MITRQDLLKWLRRVDKKLPREVTLIAVGGTALTLLGLKESTLDVDFCLAEEDLSLFKDTARDGLFKVDLFCGGYIFTLQLPRDYVKNAEAILFPGKNILLKALSLEDIVITKTARFHARDIEDIQAVIQTGKIKAESLQQRFKEICESYAGNEEEYKRHFSLVLTFWEKQSAGT